MAYAHLPVNWNMYYRGENLSGIATSMELPKIEPDLEVARYAGHFGEVPHNVGLKELKASWEIMSPQSGLGDVGKLNSNSTIVTARGSTTSNTSPETICLKAVMVGTISSHEIGKYESGKPSPSKFEMILTRFEYYVDGAEAYYIQTGGSDTPVYRVNGVDQWAAQVACLAL
jgi:P2 family phage contractile tail tube protein